MATAAIMGTLLGGMWSGYRRWMSLFNTISILLSVVLALVILSFAHGVRSYVDATIRKEAAAGAVRIHLSGWQPEGMSTAFATRVNEADLTLRGTFDPDAYLGFNFWWRSEAHYLSLVHPADDDTRGSFSKLGNTDPDDPEAKRVAPYVVAGTWVAHTNRAEIILSSEAALKLSRRLPGPAGVSNLVGREIWITLPGTRDHAPAASAQVQVSGIFDHLRDAACMTTPGVIQEMYARIRANANGPWFETYDRLAYRIESMIEEGAEEAYSLPEEFVPLVCWRVQDYRDRWVHLRGPLGESAEVRRLREEAHQLAALADEHQREVEAQQQEAETVRERLTGAAATAAWLEAFHAAGDELFPGAGGHPAPRDLASFQEMVGEAVAALDIPLDADAVTNRTAYLNAGAVILSGLEKRRGELESEVERLEKEMAASQDVTETARQDALRKEQAAADAERHAALTAGSSLRLRVVPDRIEQALDIDAPLIDHLPPSDHTEVESLDARFPRGYVLCSPRVWSDLGYDAAPLYDVGSWRDEAIYAYLYFSDLRTALSARSRLSAWGFETYMPIDRFRGLVALVRLVTWSAGILLAAVLTAGLLGIAITLYTEVDAEESEIGLLKSLGASNRLVGSVFLLKGGLVGLVGVLAGIPAAAVLRSRINEGVTAAVAETVGITDISSGFLSSEPWMVAAVAAGIVLLSALAALMPALQAAAKDPQEALRAE